MAAPATSTVQDLIYSITDPVVANELATKIGTPAALTGKAKWCLRQQMGDLIAANEVITILESATITAATMTPRTQKILDQFTASKSAYVDLTNNL